MRHMKRLGAVIQGGLRYRRRAGTNRWELALNKIMDNKGGGSSGRKRTWLLVGASVACFIGFLFALLMAFQDNLFRWHINPRVPFQTYTPPPSPDYAKDDSWAARPETAPPGAWETPWGVDVFFIHPTTYYSSRHWNAPIDHAASADRVTQSALPNHAGPFGRAGELYAPRYRQATLLTELNFGDDARRALELAYTDITQAFSHYLEHDNQGRAIMLVGVGQGGLHAQRLLAEEFSSPDMQERLVAAWFIDAATPMSLFKEQFSGFSACERKDEFGCVISWGAHARGQPHEAERFRDRSKVWTPNGVLRDTRGEDLLCVNPLTWRTDTAAAPRRQHRGGASATGLTPQESPAILPTAVATQCHNGALAVSRPKENQLRRGSGIGTRFKSPDFNIFYADIEANALLRAQTASAWLDENAPKPAPPLPPMESISIVPVTEVLDQEVNPSARPQAESDQ